MGYIIAWISFLLFSHYLAHISHIFLQGGQNLCVSKCGNEHWAAGLVGEPKKYSDEDFVENAMEMEMKQTLSHCPIDHCPIVIAGNCTDLPSNPKLLPGHNIPGELQIQYSLYIIHCTLYIVHCTMYIEHYIKAWSEAYFNFRDENKNFFLSISGFQKRTRTNIKIILTINTMLPVSLAFRMHQSSLYQPKL